MQSAAEQGYTVANRDAGKRRADVDIHALVLESKGGEFVGLRMFAGHLDGDVYGHLIPPACFQSGGSKRVLPGRC